MNLSLITLELIVISAQPNPNQTNITPVWLIKFVTPILFHGKDIPGATVRTIEPAMINPNNFAPIPHRSKLIPSPIPI